MINQIKKIVCAAGNFVINIICIVIFSIALLTYALLFTDDKSDVFKDPYE